MVIPKPPWLVTAEQTLSHSVSDLSLKNSQAVSYCLAVVFLVAVGCATPQRPPIESYNLAYMAVESARQLQAVKYAPALWAKAEQHYREGQDYFKRENFQAADGAFLKARNFAERAENVTRLKRFELGEGVF